MPGATLGLLLIGVYVFIRSPDGPSLEPAQDPFARLAARSLELPRQLASDGDCQLDVGATHIPGVPTEGGLGPVAENEERTLAALRKGPVDAVIGAPPRVMSLSAVPGDRWATQDQTLWISKSSYRGPVLVRGGRLDRRSRIRFGDGADPRLELRLGAGEWDEERTARFHGAPLRLRDGWRAAVATTRIRASGCYAFQVDGQGFGYVLPFAAVVQDR